MKEFRKIAPFQFGGVEYASVYGTALEIKTNGVMAVDVAKRLRDWLTQALPCEHKGQRSGEIKWNQVSKMTCNECGAEVPSFFTTQN